MEFILFSAILFSSVIILKKLKNVRISLTISILLLLHFYYLLLPYDISIITGTHLLPGKPDQYGYIDFGRDYKLESIGNLIEIPIKRGFHNFLYWLISVLSYNISLFDQIFTLRTLNLFSHLLIAIIFYYTVLLISKNKVKSELGMILILISPTLLGFGIYIIRDLLILLSFSIGFLSLTLIYKNKSIKLKYISLFLFSFVLSFSLRGQLGFILILMFLYTVGIIFLKVRNTTYFFILNFILFFVLYKTIEILDIDFAGSKIIYIVFNAFLTNIDFLKEILIKFPIYISGFSFLDTDTPKEFSLLISSISRILAIDSLIVPLTFLYMYIKKLKKDFFVNIVLISYFIYFSVYIYAGLFFTSDKYEGYGFHFRAMLPFFYIFYVYVISESKKITSIYEFIRR